MSKDPNEIHISKTGIRGKGPLGVLATFFLTLIFVISAIALTPQSALAVLN